MGSYLARKKLEREYSGKKLVQNTCISGEESGSGPTNPKPYPSQTSLPSLPSIPPPPLPQKNSVSSPLLFPAPDSKTSDPMRDSDNGSGILGNGGMTGGLTGGLTSGLTGGNHSVSNTPHTITANTTMWRK